jgi:hypothetical protein
MTYLGLSDSRARDYLSAFLRERLVRRADQWVAPFQKRAAVIVWEGGEPWR